MRIRRIAFVAGVAMLALMLSVSVALAGNPHFIKNATYASLEGADLVAHFKEAGLPSGAVETVVLRATQTVTYESVNGGGHNPSADNKKTTQSESSVSGNFTADKNGNIVGDLTLPVLTADQVGFTSPPGQDTVFVSVTYSNIRLVDTTSGARISIPGSLTYTNPLAPPLR